MSSSHHYLAEGRRTGTTEAAPWETTMSRRVLGCLVMLLVVAGTSLAIQPVEASDSSKERESQSRARSRIPDVRGVYDLEGSLTFSGCQPGDSASGTSPARITLDIVEQSGATFVGTIQIPVQELTTTFSGTVSSSGQLSGSFGGSTFSDGAPDSILTANFASQISGRSITLQFSGAEEQLAPGAPSDTPPGCVFEIGSFRGRRR